MPNEQEKISKHDSQYFVEYQWIPKLVNDINAGEVEWHILNAVDTWIPFLKENVKGLDFDWAEMRHEVFKVDENSVVVAYVFPEPDDIPNAAFGAVFVRLNKKAAAYYTLEMSTDSVWFIGSASQSNGHKNYGPLAQPSIESFLKWVVDRHNVI